MINIIILLGESASGKSTIENKLVKKGYKKIVSYTTREMRKGEEDGVDYHFISNQDFLNKLSCGFFAEDVSYGGWNYGIAIRDCKDDTIVVVEPCGFRQLKLINNMSIKSFYIKVNERERLIRLVKRGDNLMEVFRRIFSDQGVFQKIDKEVDYIIQNDEGQDGFEQILKILEEK